MSESLSLTKLELSRDAMDILMGYDWRLLDVPNDCVGSAAGLTSPESGSLKCLYASRYDYVNG